MIFYPAGSNIQSRISYTESSLTESAGRRIRNTLCSYPQTPCDMFYQKVFQVKITHRAIKRISQREVKKQSLSMLHLMVAEILKSTLLPCKHGKINDPVSRRTPRRFQDIERLWMVKTTDVWTGIIQKIEHFFRLSAAYTTKSQH